MFDGSLLFAKNIFQATGLVDIFHKFNSLMKNGVANFFKLVGLSLLTNFVWVIISPQIETMRDNDRGLITGLGFLLLYSLCFYLFLPKENRNGSNFFILTSTIIFIFVISSFVIVPLILNMSFSLKDHVAAIFSALFSAVCLVLLLRRFYEMQFQAVTTAIIFLCAIGTSYLMTTTNIAASLEDATNDVVNGMGLFFFVWQVSTTAAIGAGVFLFRKDFRFG